MDKGSCRSCGAALVWARSAKTGRAMPLDAEPTARGNIRIEDKDGVETGHVIPKANIPDGSTELLYTSHFATCPTASEHRKPKGAS